MPLFSADIRKGSADKELFKRKSSRCEAPKEKVVLGIAERCV